MNVDVDGDVLSEGTTTQGRGGPIAVNASGLQPDHHRPRKRRQQGQGPRRRPRAPAGWLRGHGLRSGLVDGPGHALTLPANKCNSTDRPGKPGNSRGCVEIWAAIDVIDATAPAQRRGPRGYRPRPDGIGWIDLFAKRGDIVIKGDTGGACRTSASPRRPRAMPVSARTISWETGGSGDSHPGLPGQRDDERACGPGQRFGERRHGRRGSRRCSTWT